MEIKTKLNVDDDCYFIEDNRIKKGTVRKIEITVENNGYGLPTPVIYYSVSKRNATKSIYEGNLFTDVKETLAYLEGNVE